MKLKGFLYGNQDTKYLAQYECIAFAPPPESRIFLISPTLFFPLLARQ